MLTSLFTSTPTPSRRLSTFVTVGLSLCIGWGIRGNFGHEYGAAFAGCLAAITGCLLSGRPDWREKVLYFAFFGAIGWGFGGSISYMQVISSTESGHAPSQFYGYVALFYIGFLWAALGGAGTALAAAADKSTLTRLTKPIWWLFATWYVLDLIEDPVANWLQSGIAFDHTWSRHKSPLYWFDADYLPAFFALLAAGLYDTWEQRFKKSFWLPLCFLGGALVGLVGQWVLQKTGVSPSLAAALTYTLGDPTYIDPETNKAAFDAHNFLNNWPQWFGDYPQHIGWFIGAVLGITFYFYRFGKFRDSASLIVYMAGGWLVSFLIFPVLGSLFFTSIGGLRMTPPRSDDWAGITGVFVGMILWMRRNGYQSVAFASVVCGTIGGLGFSGIQWIKQLLMAFGSPRILPATDTHQLALWADWQQQNWHSFLEQSYGFVNGIAIATLFAILAARLPLSAPSSQKTSAEKWALGGMTLFVLLGITYVNLFKNVSEWGERLNQEVWTQAITLSDGSTETVPALWDVPYLGRLPYIDFLHFTPEGWFRLTWLLLVALFAFLIRRHFKEPLALFPKTWLGKGQLLLLVLLWVMIIGNFERALVGWHPSRLLTEWVITVNAMLVSLLLLTLPREHEPIFDSSETFSHFQHQSFNGLYKKAWIRALSTVAVVSVFFWSTNRFIYAYPPYEKLDKKAYFTRFGPEATWRSKPNLKNAKHK
ncbi:MAG: hypothetical protein LCH91_28085 [Bacteroidetes bacterium]|nr:hypothetical protein [Bacteroidota bacterium]